MKDFNNPPVYLLALNSTLGIEAEIAIIAARLALPAHVKVKALIGRYDEEEEISYLISAGFKGSIQKLAEEFKQEAYLFLDQNRNAFQHTTETNSREYLGQWVSKPEVIAKQKQSYSIDPSTNTYYIIQGS